MRSAQRPSYLFEGLRAQAFWPSETFPKVVALLEAAAPELSEEVQSLLRSDSSEDGNPFAEHWIKLKISENSLRLALKG